MWYVSIAILINVDTGLQTNAATSATAAHPSSSSAYFSLFPENGNKYIEVVYIAMAAFFGGYDDTHI